MKVLIVMFIFSFSVLAKKEKQIITCKSKNKYKTLNAIDEVVIETSRKTGIANIHVSKIDEIYGKRDREVSYSSYQLSDVELEQFSKVNLVRRFQSKTPIDTGKYLVYIESDYLKLNLTVIEKDTFTKTEVEKCRVRGFHYPFNF